MDNIPWVEMLLVFVIFSAKAFDHNWKNLSHDHWTRRLWIEGLGISNWFHVASALVTWPVAIYLIYPTLLTPQWVLILVAWGLVGILLQYVWWYAKKMSGRENRNPWFVQIIINLRHRFERKRST